MPLKNLLEILKENQSYCESDKWLLWYGDIDDLTYVCSLVAMIYPLGV